MSVGEWKELHRIYLINTENPCVGGSIPSLPTSKAPIPTVPFLIKNSFKVIQIKINCKHDNFYNQ